MADIRPVRSAASSGRHLYPRRMGVCPIYETERRHLRHRVRVHNIVARGELGAQPNVAARCVSLQ